MSELIDNRAHRIRTLKSIIQRLHAGEAPEQVKNQLRELVRETDYAEIVAMEQELMADGMPVEEIKGMCDLHSQVTREVLVQIAPPALPPGHPVDTFRRENQALQDVVQRMRKAMAALTETPGREETAKALLEWRQSHNELMDIEKHYQRKENALFSKLEAHGITGPSKVMWAKDDEVRAMLKDLGEALAIQDATVEEMRLVASTIGEMAAAAVEEMIYKEANILLPMALNTLTEDEWGEIFLASPRYGWCLVAPREGYKAPESVVKEGIQLPASEGVQLPTGALSVKQMITLFETLPVDITFVDADDRVAFFSEGPDRVFARSRAIIGRLVQHCHPPKSVDTVERILSDFRSGRQSVAEFWINFQDRFVHIRYFAMRASDGEYLGTLEVTQDLTRLRALDGERRLLEYDTPAMGGARS